MRTLRRAYLGLILFFLYAPILMLVAFSFSSGQSRANWGHFTTDWYVKLFGDAAIMEALNTTVLIAVLATVISTVVGTLASIGLFGFNRGLRGLILNITYLPIINPDIVTGVSLMILFVFLRMRLGFLTMLLAHVVFCVPYVIFSVLPKLMQMDQNVYEAALDLGATPSYALRRVILPQIMPGVVTGAILAFTLSIDDFVISFFTTGSVQNLSILIYSSARKGIDPSLYALMSLMFVVILSLMLIVNGRSQRSQTSRNRKEQTR
jgi:spermidine/putrescine transport system permease protein